jgi:hypothetical protein
MTDAQPLSNATDAPDALSFDAWVQGLFVAPSKNLGGRPRGSLSRTVRSAYNTVLQPVCSNSMTKKQTTGR